MISKSADEVRINPDSHIEDENTSYTVELKMDEKYSISDEQRKEILQILLAGTKQKDNELESPDTQGNNSLLEGKKDLRSLVTLIIGFGIGALFFLLLSII